MLKAYRDVIEEASALLATAVLEREQDLSARALVVDALIRTLVLAVGLAAVGRVLAALAEEVVARKVSDGLGIDCRREISVTTVLGRVAVNSPYLRDRRVKGRTSRPVRAELGLSHDTRTPAVERALTDFGASDSFASAARTFSEHYGFEVKRTTILRITHAVARYAEQWVESRLNRASAAFEQPLTERPGVDEMLIEFDGCEIRTGTLELDPAGGTTPVRSSPKRRRNQAWPLRPWCLPQPSVRSAHMFALDWRGR